MTRRVWIWSAVLVCAAAFVVWGTHDDRDREPERASMEALVGRPLSAPTFHSHSPFARWRTRARLFREYMASPIPNQMWVWPPGDAWVYTFDADAYRPPAPFVCDAEARTCRASVGEWAYTLTLFDGSGTLVARLP